MTKTILRSLAGAFARDLPFVNGWRNTAIIGLSLGVMAFAVTVLLEPFGTAEYRAPLRTLRLAGGSVLPHLAAFLAFHALDRQVYRLQGMRWRLYNELISKAGLIIAVITLSWLYNIRLINDIAPTWAYWADYVIHFGLPVVPVMAPLYLLMAVYLGVRHPEPPPGARRPVTVRGRNHGEAETFPFEAFVFAEAQQNYAALYLRGKDGALSSQLIRATLSELEAQIPGSVRVHRSYLVNPLHVDKVTGNARKREIVMKGVERPLPASPGFDPAQLPVRAAR